MNSIFNSLLEISFQTLEQDLAERGRNRLLGQFQSQFPQQKDIDAFYAEKISYYESQGMDKADAIAAAKEELRQIIKQIAPKHFSPVLAQVMNAIGAEFAYCYNKLVEMLEYRTLAKAQGVNLDVLGMLVGQDRILFDYSLKNWFCPDSSSADQGFAWIEGANIYGDGVADDSVFRQLILAKIFKNHVKSASAPEIKAALKMATRSFVSFIKNGILGVIIAVPDSADISLIRSFCHIYKTGYIESSYLLPLPPCVNLDGIMVVPTEDNLGVAFTPDMDGHGADIGRAAIQFNLV